MGGGWKLLYIHWTRTKYVEGEGTNGYLLKINWEVICIKNDVHYIQYVTTLFFLQITSQLRKRCKQKERGRGGGTIPEKKWVWLPKNWHQWCSQCKLVLSSFHYMYVKNKCCAFTEAWHKSDHATFSCMMYKRIQTLNMKWRHSTVILLKLLKNFDLCNNEDGFHPNPFSNSHPVAYMGAAQGW